MRALRHALVWLLIAAQALAQSPPRLEISIPAKGSDAYYGRYPLGNNPPALVSSLSDSTASSGVLSAAVAVFGVKVAGAKLVSTQTNAQISVMGSALIGPEEPWNYSSGDGTSAQGWGQVTSSQFTTAIADGVASLATAAKPYGNLGVIRVPMNSALWMGYTGLDPQINGSTLSGKYYTAGTDANGQALYSGGPGGGPGTGVGHEANGDPTLYRTNIKKIVANALGAHLYVILDLHFSTPVLTSTGQNVLAIGQSAFLSTADLAFWQDMATTFGTENATTGSPAILFELFNEPFGTNSSNTTEEAWFGSQSLTAFPFPTATTGTANSNSWNGSSNSAHAGYAMFDNSNGNQLFVIRGGGKTVQTVGFQQTVNAIRATGAHNVLIIGNQTYDQHPESYSQIGGPMVVTDTLVPAQLVANQHYTSTAESIYTSLNTAGWAVMSTEMKSIPAASGGYTGWLSNGWWWSWWCWGDFPTNPAHGTANPYLLNGSGGLMTSDFYGDNAGGFAWAQGTAPTGFN